jgi:hypothetical protein
VQPESSHNTRDFFNELKAGSNKIKISPFHVDEYQCNSSFQLSIAQVNQIPDRYPLSLFELQIINLSKLA